MPQYKVFISHSTSNDPEAAKVVTTLAKKLEASPGKYGVLLDHSTLQMGEDWRSAINAWIGSCDVALLLVSRDALTSIYCQYEWDILSYRRKQTGNLGLVLPIYFGVKPKDIKDKPHQLTEIQGIEYTDPDESWKKISAILEEITPGERPGERQAGYIADILKDLVKNEKNLVRAARKVDLKIGTWNPYQDAWLDLAFKLTGAGIYRATIALQEIPGIKSNPARLSELLELVSCSWVDERSSERMRARAEGNFAERAVSVNANHAVIARMYILSACQRLPSDIWSNTQVHNVFASREDLYDQVLKALAAHFKIDPDKAVTVHTKLEKLDRFKQPVLITLQADGIDKTFLDYLREKFKTVTFLLLAGGNPLPEPLREIVESIEPALPDGYEEKFIKDYDDAREICGLS
ncbi:MAG TPA: toll/interleukin-1 receptor domain-containing protein [Terriglobales bacterium]|jgi:hypothetical protein|nr:toll/interleukin-1 receptor domain-containing protein [Terriglobales bacterium]